MDLTNDQPKEWKQKKKDGTQIEEQKAGRIINHFESHSIQNDECSKSKNRNKILARYTVAMDGTKHRWRPVDFITSCNLINVRRSLFDCL